MYEKFFSKNPHLLNAFRCGIERETLRIDREGNLSKRPHPKTLGSPLTHSYISTDFGEQQLEWNTPPKKNVHAAQKFLQHLMHFSLKRNPQELYWPFSMPCHLEEIEIAQYGTSHEARKKELYRKGLQSRYGTKLQMVSGIHFNFSFDPPFWKALHRHEKSPLPLQTFIDGKYLGIIRNFLREGWLLTYLFGASPAMDPSYAPLPQGFKKTKDFYLGPYATSIRTSHIGYYSRIQNQLAISLNTLEEYLSEIRSALSTPKKEYAKIQSQLSDHILQIENEHYSRIRPKARPQKGESPLQALEKRGIEYIEVRAIDLDPYHDIGMSPEQSDFLHQFLLYCLCKKSPLLSHECQANLTCNQDKVALEGRKEGLLLTEMPLQKWGLKILRAMAPIATLLGKEANLALQREKLKDPSLTPAALIQNDLLEHGYKNLGKNLAKLHKKTLLASGLPSKQEELLIEETSRSMVQKQQLETASDILVDGYEDLELSTQILIKEAQKWDIDIQVLDKADQFLRLQKGKHIEYVKQATKTSKDSYITAHLLENKQVTKTILKEKGLRVPEGKSYTSIDEAHGDYPLYAKKRIVVKPKSTNFGLGIFFVDPHDEKSYVHALKQAFSFGNTILVEEFCPGEEFRFLIIDDKLIGIAKRLPAHVVGDGKQTIKALVHEKNHDPTYYRDPKTYLRLGPDEKKLLKKQRLNPQSIPKKGKTIFLRHNSNVSTGGDAIDVTDSVHADYGKIALKATQALGAKICGVDMMLTHPRNPSQNYALIELNHNPVLFIHAYPYKGKRRNVAAPLLRLLGYSP